MLDWLIVGAGLHGRFVADAIMAATPHTALAVADPAAPLAAWQQRADACGMDYLRSSSAHHLGQRSDSLRRFAQSRGFDAGHYLGYYRRPSRALFEQHAAAVSGAHEQIDARALDVVRQNGYWRVVFDNGSDVRARRVVLATGPARPWRPRGLADCEHVFDPSFELGAPGRRTVIVGGGISGAQLVLRALAEGHALCWVTRTEPRRADFDSDPCYAGPRCLQPFCKATPDARTAELAAARHPGTLSPDIHARIVAELAGGRLAWQRGDVAGLNDAGLRYSDGRRLAADRVILATGFATDPQADPLLAACIGRLALATDGAGHVQINPDLEAAPGLHLVGRPASLVLGPMAANIKGARLAGQRLAAIARQT